MRHITILAAVAGLAVPALAVAGNANPNSPAAQCRAERSAMTPANFKTFYGTNANKSNAFGKCVSKHTKSQATNDANAAKRCKAEQADPNFAATHGGKTFAQFYGTNKNGKNAFGKCVSQKSDAKTQDQQQKQLNAARSCRDEQRKDPAAFKANWGTNHNKSNAFGKCVSKTVHTSS